jgi:hypothetical protein
MKTARAGLGKMIICKTFKMRKYCCQPLYLFDINNIKYTPNIAHKFKLFKVIKVWSPKIVAPHHDANKGE